MPHELTPGRSGQATPSQSDELAREPRVFRYGIEEIRRLANESESALDALAGLQERLETWGDMVTLGDKIKNNLGLVKDLIKPFIELVHFAHSLGMPFGTAEVSLLSPRPDFLISPKPEIASLFGDPLDASAVEKCNKSFYDLHLILLQTAISFDLKVVVGASDIHFPPPVQIRRLKDVVARLRELRERVDREFHPGLRSTKPRWDRGEKTLCFGKTIWRKYQRTARNVFRILDSFEEAGWPQSIPNPLHSLDQMIQTIKDFNRTAEAKSPFRLRQDNSKVAWELISRPSPGDLH